MQLTAACHRALSRFPFLRPLPPPAQAYGAGNIDALGWHFRTAVSFLLLHAVPLCAMLTAAPLLLRQGEGQGQDGRALADMAGNYVLYMLPALFIECIDRWAAVRSCPDMAGWLYGVAVLACVRWDRRI